MPIGEAHVMRGEGRNGDEEIAKVSQRDVGVEVAGHQLHACRIRRPAGEAGRDEGDLEGPAMDEWVLAPPLIGHESGQLPAFVGRHVGGSYDAVLPAASVNLLAWKIGPLATAEALSSEATRALQRQIGQQAPIRIDGEAVD